MAQDAILSLAREAIWTTVLIALPMLLSALITGLVVSILQAVTQINEATLTFIPKILAIVIMIVVTGPWMVQVMTSYTADLLSSLPELIQ